jgi:hypothetical protein
VESAVGLGKYALVVAAAFGLLFTCTPKTLAAAGSSPVAAVDRSGASLFVRAHFRRSTSYYCYPRNYWWFYRPYTTADAGYERCMPYFHYPAFEGRAPRPDRQMK